MEWTSASNRPGKMEKRPVPALGKRGGGDVAQVERQGGVSKLITGSRDPQVGGNSDSPPLSVQVPPSPSLSVKVPL